MPGTKPPSGEASTGPRHHPQPNHTHEPPGHQAGGFCYAWAHGNHTNRNHTSPTPP